MIKLIENYTGTDSWFRKWSNGLIEQGGKITQSFSTDSSYTFTFPRPFVNAPFVLTTTMIAPRVSDSQGSELGVKKGTLTATGVTFINDGYGANKTGYYWEAVGF
ncbi:MAG: hypothetical protein IJG38_02305 [Thermoguttaceae bacterium]|nr:hypothetical protein [Thermoguttaceae bacterium]